MPFLYPAPEDFTATVTEVFELGGVAGPGGTFRTTYTKEYQPVIELDEELYAKWQQSKRDDAQDEQQPDAPQDTTPPDGPENPEGGANGGGEAETPGDGDKAPEASEDGPNGDREDDTPSDPEKAPEKPEDGPDATTSNGPAGTETADTPPADEADTSAAEPGGDAKTTRSRASKTSTPRKPR